MTTPKDVASYRIEHDVAVLAIDSPPVNALSHAVRVALYEGIARAIDDPGAAAIVLICHGRTFFAGADVTEIGKPILPPLLADVMAKFETATKPIVSALHGTALGGGLELALAGHYRVAVRSAVVGLPEVALGLLPGAGGTQRVPRLIGVAAAIEMIGLGRRVTASEALELGLIDVIVGDDTLEADAIAFAADLVAQGAPLRRVRDLPTDLSIDRARPLFDAFRADHPELFVGLKAAAGVLDAIEGAITLPFDQGLDRERVISRLLVASPESAAQRHLFFAERAAAKLPGAEKEKATADTLGAPAVVRGVAEIVVGADTAPGAALAAMASARTAGHAAIFVRSSARGIVARLHDALTATIEALVGEGAARGDIAATGRAFGFDASLMPDGEGSASDALERRLIRPLLDEALAIQREGVAIRGSDIDFAAVSAKLWPVWRGGPAFMAERTGPEAVEA